MPASFENLAIVILSYNHPELTARATNSALKLHDKIYLVHNGSEKKFVTLLKQKFPNICHLELVKNRGYSGGVNYGLREAFVDSDWAILLTNDCKLENLPVLPLEDAIVAPHIVLQKSRKTDSIGGHFLPREAKLLHCKELKDFENAKNKYVPGSAFLIHKNVLKNAGTFDESLGTYWEDVDFSQRAALKNYPLKADPNWIVEHGRGKTCHKDRHYTLYLYQRNRKRISLRYTESIYKPILFIILWMTWIKLSFRLVFRSRIADLRLLLRAIQD